MTLPERIADAADRALCFVLFEWEPPVWLTFAAIALCLAAVGHLDVM